MFYNIGHRKKHSSLLGPFISYEESEFVVNLVPVLVPQMTGGLLFPGEVTEKKSWRHCDTSDSCGFAEP
jgi:hypothetical protein